MQTGSNQSGADNTDLSQELSREREVSYEEGGWGDGSVSENARCASIRPEFEFPAPI